ncbi:MAG: Bax inhibitor-1 family protein, partial [Nitrospinota bacterium]
MVRGDYGEIAGPRARTAVEERAAAFLRQVYWWMTLGLALTGIAAWAVVGVPALQRLILGNLWVFYGLIIAELVLVFTLSGRAMGMSVGKAGGIFLLYSVLTGLTLSVILLIYTASSVTQVFFITAATFAATSLWAYTTKRDLSSWGSFLFMGLIGI